MKRILKSKLLIWIFQEKPQTLAFVIIISFKDGGRFSHVISVYILSFSNKAFVRFWFGFDKKLFADSDIFNNFYT